MRNYITHSANINIKCPILECKCDIADIEIKQVQYCGLLQSTPVLMTRKGPGKFLHKKRFLYNQGIIHSTYKNVRQFVSVSYVNLSHVLGEIFV